MHFGMYTEVNNCTDLFTYLLYMCNVLFLCNAKVVVYWHNLRILSLS